MTGIINLKRKENNHSENYKGDKQAHGKSRKWVNSKHYFTRKQPIPEVCCHRGSLTKSAHTSGTHRFMDSAGLIVQMPSLYIGPGLQTRLPYSGYPSILVHLLCLRRLLEVAKHAVRWELLHKQTMCTLEPYAHIVQTYWLDLGRPWRITD